MRFLRKISLVVATILVAFLPTTSAFAALSESQLNFYAQNNILFYDPGGCVISSASPTASSPEAAATEGYGSLSGTQVAFVERFHDIAVKNSINYGIPWEAVMAQGILESAAGTSYFATDRNNYFGINAVDSDPNKAYGYATPEKGWDGYYEFIQRNSNYRQNGVFSGDAVTDPYAYIKAVKAAGYATAPDYVSDVSKVIASVENYAKSKNWKTSAELAREFPEWSKNAATNSKGTSVPNTADGIESLSSDMVSFCAGGASGELVSGGMTLDEAKSFMEYYRNAARQAMGLSSYTLDGVNFGVVCPGPEGSNVLANCSAFSRWFVAKYTNAGDTMQTSGGVYAQSLAKLGFETGTLPRPYAIFSNSSKNHTGVVLGVDEANGTVVVGHANCGGGIDGVRNSNGTFKVYGIEARVFSLAEMSNGNYFYAYTDGRLNGM